MTVQINNKATLYTFLGAPGSGKGSLAAKCVVELGWIQVSTGNLCRRHIAEDTAIGREIDFAIKSGKLVSDEVVLKMVDEQLQDLAKTGEKQVLIDGCPRTISQARGLLQAIEQGNLKYQLKVMVLKVDQAEVVRRLSSRLVCADNSCQAVYSSRCEADAIPKVTGKCDWCGSELQIRSDDNQLAIAARLTQYEKHAVPLLKFYVEAGLPILHLDAQRPLAEIFAAFKQMVGNRTE